MIFIISQIVVYLMYEIIFRINRSNMDKHFTRLEQREHFRWLGNYIGLLIPLAIFIDNIPGLLVRLNNKFPNLGESIYVILKKAKSNIIREILDIFKRVAQKVKELINSNLDSKSVINALIAINLLGLVAISLVKYNILFTF